MASEKKRVAGELMAAHVKWVRLAVWSRDPPPGLDEINPYAILEPKSAELIELEQWQARRSFQVRAGRKEPEPCL